jgi:aldose 1-epimerase
MKMVSMEKTSFGMLEDQDVSLFTLRNQNGMTVKITDFGGIITEVHVPDRNGEPADVVLGFDSAEPYIAGHPNFGVIAGRIANRIAHGRFTLDGQTYQLATNEGPDFVNHLHGGPTGFARRLWSARTEGASLHLTYVSSHMEEGYPGTLSVNAVYTLGDDNVLELALTATTDAPTVLNLVNHTYWNLAGHGSGDVLGHLLQIDSDAYTPTDAASIPTGEIRPVAETPYDFRDERAVGFDIPVLPSGRTGFDTNFILPGKPGELKTAAVLCDPASGRIMEMTTTQPAVQLYSAFKLDGSHRGKGGVPYGPSAGLCLETQHYPDSPNKPHFPSTVLRPGETYEHRMAWRFSTRD